MAIDKANSFLFYELVKETLAYSENPGKLGFYLTQNIRELIGCRAVMIFYFKSDDIQLLDVCPARKKELAQSVALQNFVKSCECFSQATIIKNDEPNQQVQNTFLKLSIQQSIFIPLNIGNEKVGAMVLHDLLSDIGNGQVVTALGDLGQVIALTLKNALLFQNLEDKIEERTKELKEKNDEYLSLNEEHIAQNAQLIEAKKQTEENENKYRLLFEREKDAIFIYNPITMEIVEANKATSLMYGYSPNELIGKSVLDFSIEVEKSIAEVEKIKKIGNTSELFRKHKKKDGSVFYVDINGYKINLKGKDFMFAVSKDITEKIKYELKLKEAKEKAEESDRLKTTFLHNMSHEIRTPMNGIIGFSDLLKNPDLTESKRASFIEIIQSSSHQLLSVIDDILEISKLGTKQVKVNKNQICLNDLILELFSIFDIKAKEKNIALYLELDIKDEQSEIITDATKLRKILSNLIENALKFTSEGFVEIGCYVDKETNDLVVYVKDTGVGINVNNYESIFERFSQSDNAFLGNNSGLGLGLSIVKENAQLLRAQIKLTSEVGVGSTFSLVLPYEKSMKNNVDNYNEPSKQKLEGNEKTHYVLVVEDEEVNYMFIKTIIEDISHLDIKLLHAKNGKEAVEVCKSKLEIELVLMDIKMPILNGFEATKQIKAIRPSLAIVAQSAYTSIQDKEKALAAGCDDFVTKPIDINQMSHLVNSYLNKSTVKE